MAKETAKRNWRNNVARMQAFALITVAVNVLYALVIMYRNGGLPGFRDLLAMGFWAGQEYICYRALSAFARPVFGPEGELLDCPDASNPKELGYYTFAQDALWVCWVVQTLCNVHGGFVVFYLPVPATVIYKAWTMVLRPLFQARFGDGGVAGGPEGPTSQARNRQERRHEERMQRKGKR